MNKPDEDEIEVSIFGTGTGECLAVHLGLGKWILIDSCHLSNSKKPLNVSYLTNLGYNLSLSVKLIICTHWHDDHAIGLSDIFNDIDLPIVISAVLQKKEFLRLAYLYQALSIPSNFPSGVNELARIFNCKRNDRKKKIIFASSNRREIINISKENRVTVEFLSPCDEDLYFGIKKFAKLIPLNKEGIKTISESSNNSTCVVTHINILNNSILCGADKENPKGEGAGWEVIYQNINDIGLIKSSVFKISHHGSENGDHDCIWTGMLENNPIALLTPFFRSKLPKDTDVKRIMQRTNKAYCTGPKCSSKSNLNPEVKKLLRDFDMDKRIHKINNEYGHIRLRKKATEPQWNIEMFKTAYQL